MQSSGPRPQPSGASEAIAGAEKSGTSGLAKCTGHKGGDQHHDHKTADKHISLFHSR